MNVWQIASGDSARNYSHLFLNHDVMFMGPGRFGPWDKAIYTSKAKEGLVSKSDLAAFRSWDERVAEGDIVLLRYGYRVISIGLIADAEFHSMDQFDDVFGWDLQHTMRVTWQEHLHRKLEDIQSKRDIFASRKQIPTFTAVSHRETLDQVEHLFSDLRPRPLKRLPEPIPKPLALDELGEALFARGIPNEAVDRLILAIQRQRRLTKWYETQRKSSGRPTEHEVVAHMLLPILIALGWSEQLLAIEWKKIDLAGFWGTPTTPERCALVCEAKIMGHGLQNNVLDQAIGYTEKLKLTQCKKVVMTDGIRLYIYERKMRKWNRDPAGYLNITKIRTNHIAPAGTNAIDTIVALTPSGVDREVGA
jgi:hypothetical protein